MRKRRPKKTDQENTEKAYLLLIELAEKNPQIETSLWMGALISAFVDMHMRTKNPYQNFCLTLEQIKEHYKDWWDKKGIKCLPDKN